MIDLSLCLTCLRYSFASAFTPFMFALAWRFAFAVAKDLHRKRREAAENADAENRRQRDALQKRFAAAAFALFPLFRRHFTVPFPLPPFQSLLCNFLPLGAS